LASHDFVNVERFPNSVRRPDVLVLRPEEPLLFANADRSWPWRGQGSASGERETGGSEPEESPDLDASSIESLSEFSTWLAEPAC